MTRPKPDAAHLQPLADRIVVILGGTSGLGLSGALACQRAGAKLVVGGRNDNQHRAAAEQHGDAGEIVLGDAANSTFAEVAIGAAVEKFGRLDALYHVAGVSGRSRGDGPLDALSDEGWEYTLRQNLDSLFYSNRAAVRQFLAQRSPGSVLNTGSVLAQRPAARHFATHAYAAAKAAIVGLTQSAAAYYAPHNIRFNVVAPALVDTPMAARAAQDPAILDYIATKQPLDGGRIGQPSDLDAAVVYFLSDASRFVTGQILAVDGGWSVCEGQYANQRAGN
jgi:NAD(P)-dependent dehydrogenase (short-subunit alcohol dehydrogenase family)